MQQHGIGDASCGDAEGPSAGDRPAGETGTAAHTFDRSGKSLAGGEGEDSLAADLQSSFGSCGRALGEEQIQCAGSGGGVIADGFRLQLKSLRDGGTGAAVEGSSG